MELLRIAEELKLCKDSEKAGLIDVQEYRTARRSRSIAGLVIDANGHFAEDKANFFLETLDLPVYGPFDTFFLEHVRNVIEFFLKDKNARLRLRQLSFPLASPFVERLIRHSLLLRVGDKLEKRSISQAVLIALLTFLRQSVGSCFATAPLIIVQQEKIEFLLQDLFDLITRGFLRRVIEGEEMKAPISTKTGHGDVLKIIGPQGHLDPALQFILAGKIRPGMTILQNIQTTLPPDAAFEAEELFKAHVQSPLLKCYEYTVATFSDWKTDFYKWNMFHSLGLNHEEKGGIGEKLYTALSAKLDKTNEELAKLQDEIERGMDGLRATEALLKNASSIDQIRRLKNEMKYKEHSLGLNEEEYHLARKKGEQLSKFFKFFTEQLIQFFPFYFQEVYDPEMFEEVGAVYEDRPAGFRLLYKHGRIDPTVWTMIYQENDFKSALINFFQIIEPSLTSAWGLDAGRELIREMVDEAIERIQDPIFIQTAIERTKKMHLEALGETSPRKPWAYISGGSAESLVKCYFSLNRSLTKFELFPSAPIDLCLGLIELMKDMPYQITNKMEKSPLTGLLMISPSHAFVFKPGLSPFLEAWQDKGNTFTYLRDEVIEKARSFYDTVVLSPQEIYSLELEGKTIRDLYQEVRSKFPHMLPLFEERLMSLLLANGAPRPFVFADSNWASDFLAFVVSPETGELEIWRYDGFTARPLHSWKGHFNKKAWSVVQL